MVVPAKLNNHASRQFHRTGMACVRLSKQFTGLLPTFLGDATSTTNDVGPNHGLVLDVHRKTSKPDPVNGQDELEAVMAPKQVIVMRRDLGMRRGKEIAQGAHAAMIWLSSRIRQPDFAFTEPERLWLDGSFTKVCVRVDSEEELLAVVRAAHEAGITAHLCVDAGRTEFHGVPTPTCCAIGPDFPDRIDPITGHLKLL